MGDVKRIVFFAFFGRFLVGWWYGNGRTSSRGRQRNRADERGARSRANQIAERSRRRIEGGRGAGHRTRQPSRSRVAWKGRNEGARCRFVSARCRSFTAGSRPSMPAIPPPPPYCQPLKRSTTLEGLAEKALTVPCPVLGVDVPVAGTTGRTPPHLHRQFRPSGLRMYHSRLHDPCPSVLESVPTAFLGTFLYC